MTQILVVDDELDIAEAVRAVLEAEGYEVETAADGAQCLETLRHRRPDLVLLDVMMPGVDGFGVLERMRQDDVGVPVVMMSAIRPDNRLADYDIKAFLKKPFHLETLLDTVETALNG
jgi:two-component system OmpR family response regulator